MGPGYHYSPLRVFVARALELLFTPVAWLANRRRDGDVRRILILEPFVLGDAALLAVLLAPLKRRFPGAEIHLLVQPLSAELFSRDSRVTRAHGFVFPWARRRRKADPRYPWAAMFRFVRELRALRFDIGIDTRGEVRSQILMLLAGCRRRVGFTNYLCSNMTIRGRLLTDNIGDVPLQHRAQINLALCAALGCTVDRENFLPALEWPAPGPREGFTVLVHTGAGWEFKLWPEAHWAELIRRMAGELPVRIRVAGAPDERPRLDAIRARVGDGCATFVITSLPELVAEINACDLMIALDSGPMNIATMLGRPVVALFGPGIVPMYAPASRGSCVVHRQAEYACAPCAQRHCIHPDHNCVASITVDEVLARVRAFVAKTRAEKRP